MLVKRVRRCRSKSALSSHAYEATPFVSRAWGAWRRHGVRQQRPLALHTVVMVNRGSRPFCPGSTSGVEGAHSRKMSRSVRRLPGIFPDEWAQFSDENERPLIRLWICAPLEALCVMLRDSSFLFLRQLALAHDELSLDTVESSSC